MLISRHEALGSAPSTKTKTLRRLQLQARGNRAPLGRSRCKGHFPFPWAQGKEAWLDVPSVTAFHLVGHCWTCHFSTWASLWLLRILVATVRGRCSKQEQEPGNSHDKCCDERLPLERMALGRKWCRPRLGDQRPGRKGQEWQLVERGSSWSGYRRTS